MDFRHNTFGLGDSQEDLRFIKASGKYDSGKDNYGMHLSYSDLLKEYGRVCLELARLDERQSPDPYGIYLSSELKSRRNELMALQQAYKTILDNGQTEQDITLTYTWKTEKNPFLKDPSIKDPSAYRYALKKIFPEPWEKSRQIQRPTD